MATLKKIDLARELAKAQNISVAQATRIITSLFDLIEKALVEGDEVELSGFGRFEVKERAGRTGINPHTREPLEIPPTKSIRFTPRKAFKEAVKAGLPAQEDTETK